jgi:hypothetical protein
MQKIQCEIIVILKDHPIKVFNCNFFVISFTLLYRPYFIYFFVYHRNLSLSFLV